MTYMHILIHIYIVYKIIYITDTCQYIIPWFVYIVREYTVQLSFQSGPNAVHFVPNTKHGIIVCGSLI